jgi:hypothetical protein
MPAPRLVGKPTVYPGAGIMLAGAPSGVPQKPRATVAGRGLEVCQTSRQRALLPFRGT